MKKFAVALALLSGLAVTAFAEPTWTTAAPIARIFVTPTQFSPASPAPAPEICMVELNNGSRYALQLNRGTEFMFQLLMQAKSTNKSVLIWHDPSVTLTWTGISDDVATSARQLMGVGIQ